MSILKDLLAQSQKEPTAYQKKQSKIALLILLGAGIIGGGIAYFAIEWRTVDESLAKYDFVEARNIASNLPCRGEDNKVSGRLDCPRTEQLIKVIVAEANYMAENSQYDKAISVIEELNSLELYNKLLENNIVNKPVVDLMDDLYSSVIFRGILNEELSKKQVNIYLMKVKNESIRNQILKSL